MGASDKRAAEVPSGGVGIPVDIRTAHPDNYGSRHNAPIDLVVVHTTESQRDPDAIERGALPSAVMWFRDPRAEASAHYVVGHDGRVYGCVPEGLCAWHAGNALVNRRSIGIEVEGVAGRRSTWFPEVMAALVSLVADVCQRHGIPVDARHIIGHADVPDPASPWLRGGKSHHTDPGEFFDRDALIDAVRMELGGGDLA